MAKRCLNYSLPPDYDITIPTQSNDDTVRRRSYSMDDMVRMKLSPIESALSEVGSSNAEKVKTVVVQNSVSHIADESNSVNDQQSNTVDEKKDREEFIVIWLDQKLDADNPDLRNLAALREVVDFLHTFTDIESCCDYISNIRHENVYLIVSGATGSKIVPVVHDWIQIRSIYVLCRRKQEQQSWTAAYTKIRPDDIFINVKPLIVRLKIDLYKCQKVRGISYKIERSIVDIHSNEIDFHWSYRLTQTLIAWPRYPAAQNQLIEYMREYYNGNQSSIEFLEEFARDYIPTDAIRWYTRAGCLFRLVNRAFRDENIDEVFKYRSFIKDLSEQITLLRNEQREYGPDEYILYRGTCLSYDDIVVLKSNQGKLISFNGFLSTALDRDIALVFVQPSNEQEQVEAVLFEYHVNTNLDTPAYAYIGYQSAIPDEQEVLFNIGAIFQIESIKYDSNEKLWLVRCILCEKKDLGRLHMKGISSFNESVRSIVDYGHILTGMGEYYRAEKFFRELVKEVNDNDAKAILLFLLANIYSVTGDWIRFSETFQKALSYSSGLDTKLNGIYTELNLYRKVGCACSTAAHFDDALLCFALDMSLIKDDNTIENRKSLAKTLGAIGHTYFQLGEYATALECYKQEAKLAEDFYTGTIEQVDFYQRLGSIYAEQTDFAKGLEYLGKALDIARKILPSNHPNLHALNTSIGSLYLQQGYLELALQCFTTVVDFLSEKPELGVLALTVYANLGNVYFLQKNSIFL